MNDRLAPPFFVSDQGDIGIFSTLEAMASNVEIYDVPGCEFFDAHGSEIRATAEGYVVRLSATDPPAANPDRLDALLRSYFSRLPGRLAGYAEAASNARNLDDLVKLRKKLEERPRPAWWARLVRRAGRRRQP